MRVSREPCGGVGMGMALPATPDPAAWPRAVSRGQETCFLRLRVILWIAGGCDMAHEATSTAAGTRERERERRRWVAHWARPEKENRVGLDPPIHGPQRTPHEARCTNARQEEARPTTPSAH